MLPVTPFNPHCRRYHGALSLLRVDLERIHDTRNAWKPEAEGSRSGVVIRKRTLLIDESRPMIDSFDFDALSTRGRALNPRHEQIALGITVFQNISPKFRGDGCEHGDIGRSKLLREALIPLNVQHGNMKICLCLNIKPA